MYTIKTKLGAEHLELIKIFFNANDLSVYVSEYKEQMGPEFHSMLQIEYDNNNDDNVPARENVNGAVAAAEIDPPVPLEYPVPP